MLIVITHIMTASKSLAGKALSISHCFLNLCRATAISICCMEFHFLSSTAPEMLDENPGTLAVSRASAGTHRNCLTYWAPSVPSLPQQWFCRVLPHRTDKSKAGTWETAEPAPGVSPQSNSEPKKLWKNNTLTTVTHL